MIGVSGKKPEAPRAEMIREIVCGTPGSFGFRTALFHSTWRRKVEIEVFLYSRTQLLSREGYKEASQLCVQ
jgi:hypothetical protein